VAWFTECGRLSRMGNSTIGTTKQHSDTQFFSNNVQSSSFPSNVSSAKALSWA
jgi:hypothetical protein